MDYNVNIGGDTIVTVQGEMPYIESGASCDIVTELYVNMNGFDMKFEG